MKNPLDSVAGTLWSGFIITLVLWVIIEIIF
jgi:hypothetical protein